MSYIENVNTKLLDASGNAYGVPRYTGLAPEMYGLPQVMAYDHMDAYHMVDIHSQRWGYNTTAYPSLGLTGEAAKINLNFVASYPTSASGAGNDTRFTIGAPLLRGSLPPSGMTNQSGVYLAPSSGSNIYLHGFEILIEVANSSDITKDLDVNAQTLNFVHNGITYCTARTCSGLFILGDVTEHESVFTPHFTTYKIHIPAIPAGRFDGDLGQYFQIRTSNNTFLNSTYITNLYFAFRMSMDY